MCKIYVLLTSEKKFRLRALLALHLLLSELGKNSDMSNLSHQKVLHIVNDNVAAKSLKDAGLSGEILPWQDALYEGPVIACDDINKLSRHRAEYFATRGYGDYKSIERAYDARNAILKKFIEYSQIILWFDFDLFGQLQLIQLVDWFSRQDTGSTELMMIDQQKILHARKMLRIGQYATTDIVRLYQTASEITLQQVDICHRAWGAFTNATPHKLQSFYPRDLSSMPFLKNAFARLVQEYPSRVTGLSRTEFLIIDAVKNKMITNETIYNYVQKKEPVAFMSKPVFQHHLDTLILAKSPVLKKVFVQSEVALEIVNESNTVNHQVNENECTIDITNLTNQVLNKWIDWIQLNGINRWIGGVHLNDGNMWRYDPITRQLHKTYV